MDRVILVRVASVGVHQDVEPAAIEHQPRHEAAEFGLCEFYLVHRLRMWPDRLVMPAAHFYFEGAFDPAAELRRDFAGIGAVIDVSVIILDLGGIGKSSHRSSLPGSRLIVE